MVVRKLPEKEVVDIELANIKMILEIIWITLEIIVLVKNNLNKNNKKNRRSSRKD